MLEFYAYELGPCRPVFVWRTANFLTLVDSSDRKANIYKCIMHKNGTVTNGK